jgi:hypothetical protein
MAFVPNLRTLRVALIPRRMKAGLERLANGGGKCRCPSCGDSVELFMAQAADASGDMLRAYDACPRCTPTLVGSPQRATNCMTLADHRIAKEFDLLLAA